LRFGAHGGRGDGVGIIATEESVARLVHSRLTIRSWGGECGLESGGRLRGGAAVAKVFRPPRRAGGKFKAKMASGGSVVQMADAAGAAGSGANGAGSPAGRAGSEASVRSGSRRDGLSADNGRDKHGGDYPDGADDQEAESPLVEGAGLSPIRRTYFSPPPLGTRDGIPIMSDDVLMDAATNNRRVALVCVEQGHWGVPPRFLDILNGVPDDHVDAVVAEVHGNANYGNQDEARQAYEVLAYANELVRNGRPFHDFHTRLYAWALLFPVNQMGTFEVAANNSGRLRRAWPDAVFLSRRTATELSVSFAQEAGMEDYREALIEAAREAEHAVEEKFDARTLALTSPFRALSYAPAHRRAQDAARITSRGLLPTAWCSGVIRAPRHFDLSRWFPRYPRWWLNRGVWMETPYALSYMAHKLVDEFSAVWHVVDAEYYYFLAAGWVNTRGFGIMIRIKHRAVSSGILLAATSYVHQSFHKEPEQEVSFPEVSSVLLSHWMARRFQQIYPDISGYIPDSAEKPGF